MILHRRSARAGRGRWRLAAGLSAAGAAVLVAWLLSLPEPAPTAETTVRHRPDAGAFAGVAERADLFEQAAASGAANGARSVEAIRAALYDTGSLRQTEPDGGWSLDGRGVLRPSNGVRRRFDQLLTGLGEATADELGRLLRAQAESDIGPAGAEQVIRLWDAYVGLQRHRYRTEADPGVPAGWQAALDERVEARRAALGPAWADAFYRDEETATRSRIAAASVGAGSPAVGATDAASLLPDSARRPGSGDDLAALQQRRIAEFGAEAARRLADEDAAQQRWDERLAQARAQIARWNDAPELSSIQRAEAIERTLQSDFEPAERPHVRALLKLDSPR